MDILWLGHSDCLGVGMVGGKTANLSRLAETILIESDVAPYVTAWARASLGLIGMLRGDLALVEERYATSE